MNVTARRRGTWIFERVSARHKCDLDALAVSSGLKVWLAGLVATYDDKIIPIDASAAALAGQLEAKASSAGHDPRMADAMIAGIAKAQDLVVVTHNAKHFAPFGIGVATPNDAARLG